MEKIITPPLSIFLRRVSSLGAPIHLIAVAQSSLQFTSLRPSHKATMYTSSASNTSFGNVNEYVDLRSDTVTKPCDQMREIMAKAIVGDDVYGEDPTINALEARCAKLFGKEAALFVATGTMGNLIAVMAHTQRGDEIIVGKDSHIHRWEQGNYAQYAGVSAATLEVQRDGTLKVEDIRKAIRYTDDHMPTTTLICLENTHNFAGGKAISLEYITKVRKIADEYNLKLHLDGARVYNAAVKLKVSIEDLCKPFDTVQMCLSKGLGAPVGSIIVGPKDFIVKARRIRKSLGGGWRQAGVLASAAMYALDMADSTIREDQRRATELGKALASAIPEKFSEFVQVDSPLDEITNMVLLRCKGVLSPQDVVAHLRKSNVLVMHFDDERVRMVMNRGVDDAGVAVLIKAFKDLLENLSIN